MKLSYYCTCFLLSPGACDHVLFPEKTNIEPSISLITGQLRSIDPSLISDAEPNSDTTVMCRNHVQTVSQISPAGMWLEVMLFQLQRTSLLSTFLLINQLFKI